MTKKEHIQPDRMVYNFVSIFKSLKNSPTHVGSESFHCANAFGTVSHLIAVDPWRIYPGLHSKRTNDPTANSFPILFPNLGSGTELHCVALVLGTAANVQTVVDS